MLLSRGKSHRETCKRTLSVAKLICVIVALERYYRRQLNPITYWGGALLSGPSDY